MDALADYLRFPAHGQEWYQSWANLERQEDPGGCDDFR
jgi:hypothetical protein